MRCVNLQGTAFQIIQHYSFKFIYLAVHFISLELSTIDNTQATDKTFKPKTDFFHSFFRKEKIIESLL